MEGNRKAFLDMIADSEHGAPLLAVSDNGYNVIVGSRAAHPILFDSYADHPHRVIKIERKNLPPEYSSAAGRYQIMEKVFRCLQEDTQTSTTVLFPTESGCDRPSAY